MRRRDVILHGQSDDNGNFLMANKQEMQHFFKQWPRSFFTLKIEVQKTKPLSLPLKSYYFKKIVPDMQRGYLDAMGERYTLKQVDEKLRELSPICVKEEYIDGSWVQELMTVEDLDNQQLVFFIEHLKELAAEHFGIFIEDPSNLIN